MARVSIKDCVPGLDGVQDALASGPRWVHMLGCRPYHEVRLIQNRLVAERVAGAIGDGVLCCLHPPTITLGNRSTPSDREQGGEFFRTRGIDVVEVDRGGRVTYHGPGQIVLYPVISLRELRVGVREFVLRGLQALASVIPLPEERKRTELEPAGVWVEQRGEWKKVAAVGLRVTNGVTNHGFSFNISSDLEVYRHFSPCGLGVQQISSLSEVCGAPCSVEEFLPHLPHRFLQTVLDGGISRETL